MSSLPRALQTLSLPTFSPRAVLVTGGAGFIGSHLVDALVAGGHAVRVVDNLSTGLLANLAHHDGLVVRPALQSAERPLGPGMVEVLVGDLSHPGIAEASVAGVDTVFHLAALGSVPRSFKDPIGSHDANVTATLRLCQAAKEAGVRRIVYSSSSSVYGNTPELPKHEEMPARCRSPYATTKLAAEQYVLSYARAGLVEGVALRYFNIFGPRQRPDGPYAAVIPAWMAAASAGSSLRINGDGSQTRDFTYVENAVAANLLAAAQPADRVNGWVVNVGAGQQTSLNELAHHIETLAQSVAPRVYGPVREGDVQDSLASLRATTAVLDYTPTVTVATGLTRTWEAFVAAQPLVEASAR